MLGQLVDGEEILNSWIPPLLPEDKVFDSFKTKDQKEGEVLTQSLKLELLKRKYEACMSAIKAGDDALIKKLGCQE